MSGEEETSGSCGKHGQEDSLHKKGSIRSRSSSSHRECSRKAHKYSLDSSDSGSGGESATRLAVPMPSTSRDEVNSPQWSMVMEALAELRNDMQKLKAGKMGPAGGGDDVTTEVM